MESTRHNLRIYLIIASIVWFLSLFPALFMALFSPMMFDAPGSETSMWTVAVGTAMLSYPIVVPISMLLSWVLFAKRKYTGTIILSLIPPAWILLNMVLWVCIELFCDGRFTC